MTVINKILTSKFALAIGVLTGTILLNTWQITATVEAEHRRPPNHWANPAFDDLAASLSDSKDVIFLTDEKGLASANGRIHSCQFAIIPSRLVVRHSWASAFEDIDAGAWCICDVADPASIDDAEERVTKWSTDDKRSLTFYRFGPRLALFRTLPNPEARKKGH